MSDDYRSKDLTLRIDEWRKNPEKFIPNIAIDCVILGYSNDNVKVLLNKYQGNNQWALPGGIPYIDEDIDIAASNILQSRTGLEEVYLRQFQVFGKTNRLSETEYEELLKVMSPTPSEYLRYSFATRMVSIAYFTLVDYDKVIVKNNLYEESQWFHLDDVPKLFSDHNDIINAALKVLQSNIGRIPVGSELLPEKFTMSELRKIYEGILRKKLDRRNFQRKIMSSGIVVKLDEVSLKQGIKPSSLFSFDTSKNFEDSNPMMV